jgi:nucleotide-binding universal stress UspA family protein
LSQIKRKFSKVLAAIDGSQSSIDAAAYAAAIARKNNAQLIVLHILFSPLGYNYSSGKFGDETIPSSVKQIFGAAKNEAEQWLNKIKERTGEVIRTEVIVTDTSVAGAIVRYAEEYNVDLILVGTRGRSSFTKLLLGSVASPVLTYAHCPVLLIR